MLKYNIKNKKKIQIYYIFQHFLIMSVYILVKDITEECEKGFTLFTCVVRAVHDLQNHEEHERVTTDKNEEAEQTV